jgi:hypothetical protein
MRNSIHNLTGADMFKIGDKVRTKAFPEHAGHVQDIGVKEGVAVYVIEFDHNQTCVSYAHELERVVPFGWDKV